ncbi:MAG: hypothetical protein GEU92_14130, partial [Alphaproteobacteria bacterium]|nr:hypothetical protein [Alphaproteobacteria bacterium]
DTFGPHNGFWVSVAAGAASLSTVLLGQRSLRAGAAAPRPKPSRNRRNDPSPGQAGPGSTHCCPV